MHFALAVAIALNFWATRGVETPCVPVPVHQADAQMPRVGFGDTGRTDAADMAAAGCSILLSTYAGWERHHEPRSYCAEIVHEVGHIAGLPHSEDGVMNARMTSDSAIWDCVHWKAYARRHQIALKR